MARLKGVYRLCAAGVLAWLAAGCASVTSRVETAESATGDGLVYFMPRKPIKFTVAVDANGVPTPSIDPIDATADTSRRFLLSYEKNLVGKNHLSMGVTSDGLLTSSNADTTSGVVTIAQNLGKAIAAAQAMGIAMAPATGATTPHPCAKSTTHVFLIFPEETSHGELCDFRAQLYDLAGKEIVAPPVTPGTADSRRIVSRRGSQAGIFYKYDLPYLVKITDTAGMVVTSAIAFSPDLSPVSFVPVTRTVFSDNHTNITLSRGTVTAVDEQSDGELVALTELPADFVSAYATAVGQLFSAFGTASQNRTTLLNNQNAQSIATVKREACALALKANGAALDPQTLKGKDAASLAAAVDAINAALKSVKDTCS